MNIRFEDDFDDATLKRGRDYAARGLVVKCEVDNDGSILSQVSNGRGKRYKQFISFRHGGIAGVCSCPMDVNCKHVVAVLIASGRFQDTKPTTKPAQATPKLAPSVVEWLQRVEKTTVVPQEVQLDPDAYPATVKDRLLYVLTPWRERLAIDTFKGRINAAGTGFNKSMPRYDAYNDRLNWHKSECEEKLAMTMAGKAAEIIKYGPENVSNGPAGDIQQASALARAMVLQWGMSDKVGNIDYREAAEGYSGNTAGFSVSANTKEMIEQEVKRFIQDAYDRAFAILTERKDEWDRLAQGLLEYETLTGEEIKRVMRGESPHSGDGDESGGAPETPSITAIPKTKPKSKARKDDGDLEPEPTV